MRVQLWKGEGNKCLTPIFSILLGYYALGTVNWETSENRSLSRWGRIRTSTNFFHASSPQLEVAFVPSTSPREVHVETAYCYLVSSDELNCEGSHTRLLRSYCCHTVIMTFTVGAVIIENIIKRRIWTCCVQSSVSFIIIIIIIYSKVGFY
jgi:hypothetical protein